MKTLKFLTILILMVISIGSFAQKGNIYNMTNSKSEWSLDTIFGNDSLSNDLAYEDNQLKFITDFKKDIDVVFLRCDEEFSHISSSAIRSLELFRVGSGYKYCV